MKKRNQLVGALLAGLLLGGGLTGTTIWAASEDAAGTAAVVSDESETAEDSEEARDTSNDGSDGEAGNTDNSSSGDVRTESGQVSGSVSDESDSSAAEQETGKTEEEENKQQASEEEQKQEAAQAQAEAEAAAKAESDAKTMADAEAAARQSEAEAEAEKQAQEAAQAQAEAETAARQQAQQSQAAQDRESGTAAGGQTAGGSASGRTSSGSTGTGTSSAGSTSSGNFVLTETQRIQNLRIGFQQIAKQYAIANVGDNRYLRIRDNKSTSANVVGTVNNGGLLYILADDDPDWLYVESGDVRGFVMKKWLTLGTAARQTVEQEGEAELVRASATVSPTANSAYRYSLNTVETVFTALTTANRQEIINYALSFVGGRYVWGGDDPHTGADCSGFVKYVYEHFGYTGLPRVSYEQCYAGTRIDAKDAKAGDLLFYARDGVVYHVLMYIGGGKAVNAQSTATGIVVSDVNYDKVCWGVRLISDSYTSTQASSLVEDGKKATNGDANAQLKIIQALATASQKANDEYGFPKSVLIAQAIQESGWLSFQGASDGGIQPSDNNILGMNASLLNNLWSSPWNGTAVNRNVPQSVNGRTVMGIESMRSYSDIESCLEDYAAFKIGLHPDLRGSKDIDKVISEGLAGYATDPSYETSIRNIIIKYNLTQYDVASGYAADTTSYSDDQLDLIYAVVAQEDDTGYDGALAVISAVMNRADQNYGGYGNNALSQLTADGQFAYSSKVSDPALYRKRLNGNVPDYVKQAVSDCLTRGVRNHNFLHFGSTNSNGISTRIGANWYYN